MDIRSYRYNYAVIYDWELLGEALVQAFHEEEEAHEFAASLPREAYVVELIGYRANRQHEMEAAYE